MGGFLKESLQKPVLRKGISGYEQIGYMDFLTAA